MRINDGSQCARCQHLEHECADEQCSEICLKFCEIFNKDYDSPVKCCPVFEE